VQRWLAIGLLVTGLGFLGAWTWEQLDSRLYQHSAGRRLQALHVKSAKSASVLPNPSGRTPARKTSRGDREPIPEGDPIGRIEIDRVGLSAIVAEGIDVRTLRRAVGHVPTTPLPGDDGNVVLAGHRDSFFRPLRSVEEGDRIRLTTPDEKVDYEITSIEVVGAEDIDVMWPTRERTLTLITCYPFHYIGPAPDRYVVRARQVD
jgi:sortase A